MAFNHEQIRELEDVFDGRYMQRAECNERQDDTYKKIEAIHVEAGKIATKLNMIAGILGGIGAAVAAAVVKILFGG